MNDEDEEVPMICVNSKAHMGEGREEKRAFIHVMVTSDVPSSGKGYHGASFCSIDCLVEAFGDPTSFTRELTDEKLQVERRKEERP